MKGENKRDYVVPFAEETAYLKKAEGVSRLLFDVVTILLDSGIRPEESYRLRWEYVMWDSGLYGVFHVTAARPTTPAANCP